MQDIFNSERWHFNDPDAYWTIQYEYRRYGADMQYRFNWKAWVRWSTSWYDYGLQLRLFLDGVRHDVTVKGVTANNPGWSYEGTTEWYTVTNKTTGTTQFYTSMYDTSRSATQATSSTYQLIVSPCGATLVTAPNFSDNDNPTINYKNPAGNSVDILQACISWTGGADIAYRPIPKTGTTDTLSFTFDDLTEAERDALRNATPTGVRNVTFYVTTWIGSDVFDSTQPVELSIDETEATKPSVSMSVTLDNGSLPNKFDGLWIQGKSRADILVTAEGKYNASINNSSFVTQIGKTAYNSASFKSNVIDEVGNVDIVAAVKDSREFTGEAKETVSVIQYSKPLVIPLGTENAILCYRSDDDGNRVGNSERICVKAKRFYQKVYAEDGKALNECVLQWRWKESTEAWGGDEEGWDDLISKDTTNTDEYQSLLPKDDFDVKKSYTVQIRAIDDIGEYDRKEFDIPTQDVALHLGKGGKKVTVGTYCDSSEEYDYTFRSAWKAIFDEGFVDGTDTGWKALNDYTSYRHKCGYVTVVVWSGEGLVLKPNDYIEVATIPEGYRPALQIPFTYYTQGGIPPSQSAYIGVDGKILVYTAAENSDFFAFTVTYPI